MTTLSAFYAADFLGSGSGSNSTESNSYVLRERELYATYARKDWDFYVLGGQSWSLATMFKTGITPRQENVPLTIDAQYVPGFVWTRNTQIRFVKGFDHDRFDLGLSFESPQASYYTGGNGNGVLTGTVDATNTGSGTLNPDTSYSDDIAPDVILKGTADPGWGHYEVFGLARFLHDRTSLVGSGKNRTVPAGGAGAGAILPLVKGKLDLQGNVLVGDGIGRYGSVQLPDSTFSRNGDPLPLPEVIAMVGLVGHPVKALDLYAYVGTEQITHREAFTAGGKGYGYGSALYSNAGCNIEEPIATTLASPCTANTSGVVQGTLGGWWRFLKGRLRHHAGRHPVVLHAQDSVLRCRRRAADRREHGVFLLPLPAVPVTRRQPDATRPRCRLTLRSRTCRRISSASNHRKDAACLDPSPATCCLPAAPSAAPRVPCAASRLRPVLRWSRISAAPARPRSRRPVPPRTVPSRPTARPASSSARHSSKPSPPTSKRLATR